MAESTSFANNFWGKDETGYHRVFQRMHHAKQTCEEVATFYKERAAIEQEYSKKLMALSRKPLGSHETGSLRASLDTVKATTEAMAKSHDLKAKQLTNQLQAPLVAFAASARDRRKTVEDTMSRLTKAKLAQNATTEKLRSKYESECHKISGFQAQQNLLMGPELEKNNQKLERSKFNVETAQRQYQDSLRVLAQTMEAWNAEWKVSCDKLQALEDERINFQKSNLWAFANAVSTVCVSDDEGCETIRVALEKCEAAKDLTDWVRENGTGSHIQDPPEFVNFMNGFSRDDNDGHYRVANFEQPETDRAPIPRLMASKSIPNLAPDSPPMSYDSPGSPGSEYSANTVHSSPVMDAKAKRRSWAMPFKRKSSPDLGKFASTNSFDFESPQSQVPVPQAPAAQAPVSPPPTQTQTQSEDPLVAALEKLKPRPVSLPPQTRGFAPVPYGNTGGSPYGNGHQTTTPAATAPGRSRSPVRKQVGTAPQSRSQSMPRSKSANEMYQPPFQPYQQPYQPYQNQAKRQSASAVYQGSTDPYQASGAPYPVANRMPRNQNQMGHQQAASMGGMPRPQQLPPMTTNGQRVVRHSRAQYDYRAAIPEEVSFRKGDVMLVTTMQDDGWWEVEVLGKRRFGLAPSNFLVDI